jgi:16S rRNA (guanine966-N2)-methyltransferase
MMDMRIIAGEFRGRKLLPPETDATRPVTDRVKQSVFDILTPLLPDAVVYDCFAGTGSMGLESLSRSARRAVFFENDRSAASRLRKNVALLEVAERSRVIDRDLFRWFADDRNAAAERADVIFLDPPYRFLKERAEDLRTLATNMVKHHLATDGTIVFRHDVADSLEFPGLEHADVRTYGGMTVELLRPSAESRGGRVVS